MYLSHRMGKDISQGVQHRLGNIDNYYGSSPRATMGSVQAGKELTWDRKMLSDCSMAMVRALFLNLAHIFGLIPARDQISSFFGCQKPSDPTTSGLMMPKDRYFSIFFWNAASMFLLLSKATVTSTMIREPAMENSISGFRDRPSISVPGRRLLISGDAPARSPQYLDQFILDEVVPGGIQLEIFLAVVKYMETSFITGTSFNIGAAAAAALVLRA